MAMVQAKVTIEGVRPLLWHHFGPDALPLEKQERTGVAGNDPEEWKKTVLVTKKNQLYVDPSYIFGCLRDGAKYIKAGRGSIQKLVAATLQVVDDKVLVDRFLPHGLEEEPPRDSEEPVYLDVRSVVNPSTKGRNVRYRVGASIGWRATFNILWENTVVSRPQMEAVVRDAGRLCGIGNGRGIGFGRFEVVEMEIEEYAPTQTA